jgi:hypothetical protein
MINNEACASEDFHKLASTEQNNSRVLSSFRRQVSFPTWRICRKAALRGCARIRQSGTRHWKKIERKGMPSSPSAHPSALRTPSPSPPLSSPFAPFSASLGVRVGARGCARVRVGACPPIASHPRRQGFARNQ